MPAEARKPAAQQPKREEVQRCPGCGQQMPGLKGARLSICPVCGYKESCCY